MITGGWVKDEAGQYVSYHPVSEVGFACDKDELESLIDFLTDVYNSVAEGGETIRHYHDWSNVWKAGAPDIVIDVRAKDI